MTFKNIIDDDEYYKELKKYMIINHDVYISRFNYNIPESIKIHQY